MHRRKSLTSLKPSTEKGEAWWAQFQALLDDQNDWPTEYVFKFIVPSVGLGAIEVLFNGHPISVRPSKKGNYMSVTAQVVMQSSDDVVAIYTDAGKIEGVISL